MTSGDGILQPTGPEIVAGIKPLTLSYSCQEFLGLYLFVPEVVESFEPSPACASFARNAGTFNSQDIVPPNVHNGFAHTPFSCCGGCKFAIPEVEVLYWSTTSSADCSQGNATVSYPVNRVTQSSDNLKNTVASRPQAPSPVVIDGSTLEFPSLYLAIHGAVSVTDSCGVRGHTYDNPTIAIPPGSLSTISWHNNLVGYNGYAPQTGVYDPAACHTYGVDDGSTTSWLNKLVSSWETSVSYNIGPPYNPILLPPAQLTALDPDWEACTAWDDGGENAYDLFFGFYDPPRVLNTAPALDEPSTTPPDPTARQTPSAVQPAGSRLSVDPASIPLPAVIPTLDQPKATSNAAPAPPKEGADLGPQQNDPTAQENSPPQSQPNAARPNSDPNGDNDPQGGSPPKPASDLDQASDPKQGNDRTQGSSSDVDSGSGAGAKPNGDAKQGDSNQGSNQIPDSVPQNRPKQIDTRTFDDSTEGQAQTINHQVVQPLSHGVSIAGTTLTPGAPPMTVSGTPIHFRSSALVVGTLTVPLAPASPAQIITNVAGQMITAASNTVVIAGNTLFPGARGTVIDGTTLSLDKAGQLIVGSKTMTLASNVPETIITTVAGQAITAAPSGIAVAGITLKPGAPGTTLDRTLLSLDTDNHLIVGSKTIPLLYASSNLITTTIGGQIITAAANRIAIAGITLTPGASGVTVGGTLVSLNAAAQLVVGSKIITFQSGTTGLGRLVMGGLGAATPSEEAEPITTTIDGHVITAALTALAMAGTTLTPGAAGFTVNGTLVSLNTAAQLVVGTKTIPLESENAGSSGQTADLGGLIMGGFGNGGPFGPFRSSSPALAPGDVSPGAGDGTTGVQVFRGHAARLKGGSLCDLMAVSAMVLSILGSMC